MRNILLAAISGAIVSLWNPAALAQGALTPVGPPAPTMKTLDQIQPRTPISSAPYTITQPGSYYLTTNISVAGGTATNAITIAASGVTLDLSGFTISSTSPSAAGCGILLNSSLKNVAIANGSIQGGVTAAGGVYSGSGFDLGIFFVVDVSNTETYGYPANVRVSGVSVSGCLTYGICAGPLGTIVDSCTVRTVGGTGVFANTVKNSVVMDCGDTAIQGNQVSDCQGECKGSGAGISGNTVQNSAGTSVSGTAVSGQSVCNSYGVTRTGSYGVSCQVAQNCYGQGGNTGVRASSVINCYGLGDAYGIYADNSGENSYGRASTNGTGVLCFHTANNCHGYCSEGGDYSYGLEAAQANNCYGQHDGGGRGLVVFNTAIGCYGRSNTGYGLTGGTAIGCVGYRGTGTPVMSLNIANSCSANGNIFANYKYNMP